MNINPSGLQAINRNCFYSPVNKKRNSAVLQSGPKYIVPGTLMKVYFGSAQDEKKKIRKLQKEVIKTADSIQYTPGELLAYDGEFFTDGFKQGLNINEVIDKNKNELSYETIELEEELNKKVDGKTVQEHLNDYRTKQLNINKLTEQIDKIKRPKKKKKA